MKWTVRVSSKGAAKALYVAVLGLVAVVPAGCSSNLTRGRAQELLVQQLTPPEVVADSLGLSPGFEKDSVLQALQNEGLLTTGSPASLTEKGKEYALTSSWADPLTHAWYVQVKLATLEFDQITGITGDSGSAKVEYTRIYKPTPFGTAMRPYLVGTRSEVAWFQKYDDGWRLKK